MLVWPFTEQILVSVWSLPELDGHIWRVGGKGRGVKWMGD